MDRFRLVSRHSPKLHQIVWDAPLSVGNGNFAFTADVTGFQTFSSQYEEHHCPLCTLSNWGWHTEPTKENKTYSLKDLEYTSYAHNQRTVQYPVEETPQNKEIYHWLRQNPHRFHLLQIALQWDQQVPNLNHITSIDQTLNLWEGILYSHFQIHHQSIYVQTLCAPTMDCLSFNVQTTKETLSHLSIDLAFPYPHWQSSACTWRYPPTTHTSCLIQLSPQCYKIHRQIQSTCYSILIYLEQGTIVSPREHHFSIFPLSDSFSFSIHFLPEITLDNIESSPFSTSKSLVFSSLKSITCAFWSDFWQQGGLMDFSQATHPQAFELERRIILSLYLLAIQSSGKIPPAETGLTTNSWYGKFHLEMHLWHSAYLPLWGRSSHLLPSLSWYQKILPQAYKNASINGYKGARWPKMVDPSAQDSPSPIAPLLIWQQPHLIYMLSMLYHVDLDIKILEYYWDIIQATADFMADFVVLNPVSQKYDLKAPIMPAQEEYNPTQVENPTFELAYWQFGLQTAYDWSVLLQRPQANWQKISQNLALLPQDTNHYLAHQNCPDSFEKFNRDHPSMLGIYGLLSTPEVDITKIETSLQTVLTSWDFASLWGWDFAMMAMTAIRLDQPQLALDILLMDTPKNYYALNGHNYQKLRQDLPQYLPGNGSLLLAIALMSNKFPSDGLWNIKTEGMIPFPF